MSSFNIRVYGVLLNDHRQILLSDEMIAGRFYTKFPGGGLEFGEGTIDCLIREFYEETHLNVRVTKHLYTTDYFQPSAFKSDQQIISIYYLVECDDYSQLQVSSTPYAFSADQIDKGVDCEVFRWIAIDQLKEADVSLPIDKKVVSIIKMQ